MAVKCFDICNFPQRLLDKISKEIFKYSISIIGLREKNNEVSGNLLGSGTLIKYKNIKGILTAKHVVRSSAFAKSMFIGLNYEPQAHSPKALRD